MKRKRKGAYPPQWNYPTKRRKRGKGKKSFRAIVLILLFFLFSIAGFGFYILLRPAGIARQEAYIYITDTTSLEKVFQQIEKGIVLRNPRIFRQVAQWSRLEESIRPGKYKLLPAQNMLQIIHTIKYGEQVPVRIGLKNARTQQDLVLALTENLQITPVDLTERLQDSAFCASLGFDTITIRCLFTPHLEQFEKDKTSNIYWNTSVDSLLSYFKQRHDAFWTPQRIAQAQRAGFSPTEITIIASIVQEESNQEKEYPLIAGLYINRLRKGMKLQADPTARFAMGDFDIKRVGREQIRFNSPYNTYQVYGLPPGPICFPRQKTIESVLNHTQHDYIFMCAKSDFSGAHAFASTYEEHLKNARLYQKELDRRNIK